MGSSAVSWSLLPSCHSWVLESSESIGNSLNLEGVLQFKFTNSGMGFLLDSDVGFGDESSGFVVVSTNGKFDFEIDVNSVLMEIVFSFGLEDGKLAISPVGESLDFNQKFSLEEVSVVLDIEIESSVQVFNGGLQFGFEFESEVVDFDSDFLCESGDFSISSGSDCSLGLGNFV